jgi:hypothetical protein
VAAPRGHFDRADAERAEYADVWRSARVVDPDGRARDVRLVFSREDGSPLPSKTVLSEFHAL